MNVLFVSERGESLGAAIRTQIDHPTSMYVQDERADAVGEGIVDRLRIDAPIVRTNGSCIAANIDRLISQVRPNLVIFDYLGFGRVADYLRERGIAVFGSSLWSDVLLSDSDYELMILDRLRDWSDPDGEEVVLGVLWDGVSISHTCLMKSYSRLMTGDLGPDVGCVGSAILSHTPSSFSPLLSRLRNVLNRVHYRGLLTISCLISRESVFPIRFLSPTPYIPTLLEAFKGSAADLLSSTAMGRPLSGQFTRDLSLSVLLSVPPYPHTSDLSTPYTVIGITDSNLRHIHPLDISAPVGVYETSGVDGRVGWVSARGRSLREARLRAYFTISNLSILDVQYRLDVGDGLDRYARRITDTLSIHPSVSSHFKPPLPSFTPSYNSVETEEVG